uniref:G_PROTEIN_RECEP_F1_2 domain-containing protein n=1 Tax=Rhabditophanes sp. KR3021 TaxID=114890 RepID=A0AC35TI11_9BILA
MKNGTESEMETMFGNIPWPDDLSAINIVWVACCCCIFCVSVFGNTMVVYVILSQKSMRTSTNLYLLNLALSDLLLSVICMPSTVVSSILKSWIFGGRLCKMLSYLQPVSVSASAYTLSAIALERYVAICYPLHSRLVQTKSHACLMLTIVWVISFLSNIFNLFVFNNRAYDLRNPTLTSCMADMTDEKKFIYQVYITIALLVIPLILMAVLYGCVISSLSSGIRMDIASIGNEADSLVKGKKSNNNINGNNSIESLKRKCSNVISKRTGRDKNKRDFNLGKASSTTLYSEGENQEDPKINHPLNGKISVATFETLIRSTHSSKVVLAKQRLIRMLIVIVIIFFCCWTPSYCYWILVTGSDYFGDGSLFNSELFLILTTLSYLASCANPITYCFLNAKFRNALMHVFGCNKFERKPVIAAKPISSVHFQTNTAPSSSTGHKFVVRGEFGTCEEGLSMNCKRESKVTMAPHMLRQFRHSISTSDYSNVVNDERKRRKNVIHLNTSKGNECQLKENNAYEPSDLLIDEETVISDREDPQMA